MTEVVAVCGAGGKTTWIRQMMEKYTASGKKVCITTTTHMLRETFTDITCDEEHVIREMNRQGWVMAGRIDPHNPAKIVSLPLECFEAIKEQADIVLVEADGAKHHSIKCPNHTEPVFPPYMTKVVIIMGSWEIGQKVKDVVHRYHLLKEIHVNEDSLVTRDLIIRIISHFYVELIKKEYPGIAIEVYLSEKKKTSEEVVQDHKDYELIYHLTSVD